MNWVVTPLRSCWVLHALLVLGCPTIAHPAVEGEPCSWVWA